MEDIRTYRAIYEKLITYIYIRPRSIKEAKDYINSKLCECDNKEAIIRETIDRLVELKYLDDITFGKVYIRSLLSSRKAFSRKQLSYKLIEKGLEGNIISNLLDELYSKDFEVEQAEKELGRSFRKIRNKYKDNFKIKRAAMHYLFKRGFDDDIIRAVIDKTMLDL